MPSRSIRSLSAAALALTGTAVLAPSAQALPPVPGWRVTSQLGKVMLTDVTASSTRSAWAVGALCSMQPMQPCSPDTMTPFSYRWNGKVWKTAGISASQVNYLTAVSTSGPTNAWAFGYKYSSSTVTRSVHWDGHGWVTADLPNSGPSVYKPEIFSSVTLSAKDTWAFGRLTSATSLAAYIAHFDGTKWTRVAAPKNLQPGTLTSAVARSGKDIWALVLGRMGSADVLHYDGKSWTKGITPKNFIAFTGPVVRSKNDIWLGGMRRAGSQFQPGTIHFTRNQWIFTPVPTVAEALVSIADDGEGGLWAQTTNSVGQPAELWHNVRGQWLKVTLANIGNPPILSQLFHIPGTSTTLGLGNGNAGSAIFVTGAF